MCESLRKGLPQQTVSEAAEASRRQACQVLAVQCTQLNTHYGPTQIHLAATGHAIGGTAQLALRYSIIPATTASGGLRAGRSCWRMGTAAATAGGACPFWGLRLDGAEGGQRRSNTAASGVSADDTTM